VGHHREQLVDLLQHRPSDPGLQTLINRVEQEHPTDLTSSADLLHGVWELRWSSSRQPWLKPTAGLENLQILDPVQGRGCNLLRLRGPLRSLGGIRVQAELKIADSTRVAVRFRQGGWIGPSLPNRQQLTLMRQVQQSIPAWLDITVLDQELRICRGNAGTTFALLRRNDLNLRTFLGV
jgi:hypothetical protein